MKHDISPLLRKGQLVIKQRYGFSLIEALLSIALFAILATAFVTALIAGKQSMATAGARVRAAFLAEEGLEAVRNIRDSSFTNLSNGTFGLATTNNTWNLSGSQDTFGQFTRQILIGTIDTKRKIVTSTVTWQQAPGRTGTITLVTRLADWLVSKVGNWTSPVLESSLDLTGAGDGSKIQLQGEYGYLLRSSGSPNFVVIELTDTTAPSQVSSLTLTGSLNNIALLGNYAYITGDDNNAELQIVDISTPTSPSLVGTFDAAGTANATGVFVSSTVAYIVRRSSTQDELVLVSVASPSSPSLLGSLNLGSDANDIVVLGSTAYIGSSDNNEEVQVVSVVVPALPVKIGSLNLSGSADVEAIAGFSTTIVVGQGGGPFTTVSVAIPASPTVLGTVDLGGIVRDMVFGNNNTYAFVATGKGSGEFQVVDLTTSTVPVVLGSVNISGTGNVLGIAYDEIKDRAIGGASNNSLEVVIFAPG